MLVKLGLNIGLNFDGVIKGKKRKVRRLISGVMTFNDALRQDTTRCGDAQQKPDESDRNEKKPSETAPRSTKNPREEISCTKVNRGERTPVELFVAGAKNIALS